MWLVQRFISLSVVLVMCVISVRMTSAEVVGVWLFDENKGDTVEGQGYNHDGEFAGGVKWEKQENLARQFGSMARRGTSKSRILNTHSLRSISL